MIKLGRLLPGIRARLVGAPSPGKFDQVRQAVDRDGRWERHVEWRISTVTDPYCAAMLREVEAAARALGVRLQTLEARNHQEIERAFAAMIRERAGALLILPDGILLTQRRQIAELAAKGRLPSIMGAPDAYPDAGGLMAYGSNYRDLVRRAATFVDKILKGAKPADLLSSSLRSSSWS